jgi:hypothetical protein
MNLHLIRWRKGCFIITIVLPLLLGLFVSSACERDTKLTIEGGNPPRFMMKGSGSLRSLRVRGPNKQRYVDGEDAWIYWRITSEGGTARSVEDIGAITYGSVPIGYNQVYPKNRAAPSLVEGEHYYIRVDTANANGAEKFFCNTKRESRSLRLLETIIKVLTTETVAVGTVYTGEDGQKYTLTPTEKCNCIAEGTLG